MAREFLLAIVEQAREQRLLSEEHFSVDGTLLEAWASVKSFRPRDEDRRRGTVPVRVGYAIGRWTFAGSGGAMRPIGPPPTPMPGWPGRVRARKRAFVSAPTC